MPQEPTQDDVVQAAIELGQPEFTRDDLAAKLGIERPTMKPAWRAAKEAGRVEKVRQDGGKRYFRLAGK